MGHAAGQPPHRLHFLGLEELGLQGLAGRDVKGYTADMVNFPFGIAEYLSATLDPENRSIFSPDTVFPQVGLVSLQGLNKNSLGVIEVIVVNKVTPFDFAESKSSLS